MVDTVKVEFKADNSDLNKKADQSEKKLVNITKVTAGLAIGVTAAFAAIGAGITAAVKEAAKFEQIQTQFKVLTGDIESANEALKQIEEFSAGTPFQFEDVAKAGKTFLSFGFEVESITTLLQEVGDVAAASGADFQELALIYGQVAAAGKLTGERLLQLQERGIAIGPALAKSLGVAETAVKDLVSQGKVTQEVFEEAFATLSQEGGPAFGGLSSLSETLTGKISTLQDNFDQFSRNIGSFFVPIIKDATDGLTDFIKGINELIKLDPSQVRAGEIVDQLVDLNAELASLEGQSDFTKFFLGGKEAENRIVSLKSQISELGKELDVLAKAELERQADPGTAVATKAQKQAEEKLRIQRETNEALKNIDDEFNIAQDETAAERLVRLQELEEEKANLDLENKARELDAAGKHDQALALIKDNALKKDKARQKAQIALNQATATANVNIATASSNLINAVASDGSKFAFLVAKAAGIAQSIVATQLASAKALVVDPTGGLSTRVQIAGAINTAAIAATAIKGFQDGGVIGGINGATAGGDNTIAAVRTGEMVLNAGQQETLFNAIVEGNLGGTETGGEVIVRIDAGAFTDAIEGEFVTRSRENRTPIQVG